MDQQPQTPSSVMMLPSPSLPEEHHPSAHNHDNESRSHSSLTVELVEPPSRPNRRNSMHRRNNAINCPAAVRISSSSTVVSIRSLPLLLAMALTATTTPSSADDSFTGEWNGEWNGSWTARDDDAAGTTTGNGEREYTSWIDTYGDEMSPEKLAAILSCAVLGFLMLLCCVCYPEIIMVVCRRCVSAVGGGAGGGAGVAGVGEGGGGGGRRRARNVVGDGYRGGRQKKGERGDLDVELV